MRFTRARVLAATLVTGVGLAVLAVPSPATAAVTTTNITSPSDGSSYLVTNDSPGTVTVSGTTDGTTGDIVDIRCYTVGSSDWQPGPSNVPVQADGSFSASMDRSDPYGKCRLRAVPNDLPAGSDLANYTGPTVTTEYLRPFQVLAGPSAGRTYDYAVVFQSSHAMNDYSSATHEALWFSRLDYPGQVGSNYFWDGVASLGRHAASRSSVQIDGRNAYGPYSAWSLFNTNAGIPPLSFSATRDGVTGVTTIRETDPMVFCPVGAPYPPTSGSCPQFVSAGVRLERTLVANDGGRQVHVTDVWRSTDGKPHSISPLFTQRLYGFDYESSSDTALAIKLPWLGGFQTFTGDATYPAPAKLASSILIRDDNTAADGDQMLPRGAIAFDFPLTNVHRTDYDTFTTQGSAFTVAAGGVRVLRQSFVTGTGEAEVAGKAAANVARLNPYRTDALIKKKGATAYVGNGIYNTTGAGQSVGARAKRTRTVTFLVTVQNDGTQPSSYRIKGDGARRGFKFQYLKGLAGTKSITAAVTGGSYLMSNVAPGATQTIRLVVTVKAGATIGKLGSWLVLATSTKDTTRKDAVRASVRVRK